MAASTADDPFQVRAGIPNANATALAAELDVRPGSGLSTTVASSAPASAQLRTTGATGGSVTVTIAPGQARSYSTVATGGVALDPLAAGSTTVTASIAGFLQALLASQAVTITP